MALFKLSVQPNKFWFNNWKFLFQTHQCELTWPYWPFTALKKPQNCQFIKFLNWGSNQVCKYFNSEKNIETSRCHKIGFLLTKIGVFVVVGIIFLSRIQKCPKLDWKVWNIVHYGNLPWYTEQIQLIQCLIWYKLLLTKLGVK